MKQRLRAVRKAMRREGLSALAVTNLKNIHYLTGFTGSAGACLISPRSAVFITDFRYRSQAAKQVSADYRRAEHASPIQGIVKELGKTRAKALAIEEAHVTHAVFRQMRKLAKGVRLKPVSGLVEGLRLCKDAGEIQKLRRGAGVNAGALSEIAQAIRPGRAETDVALDLETAMRRRGATGPAFDTIVASGPRSALPHGIASSRKLKKGDLITIDFGAVVSGYHADTTRVFSLGKPSPKGEKIYKIVLEAQMTALEAVKPGALCGDVDKAARDVITAHGYGEAFGHGTGHGLGLYIHEAPRLGPGVKEELKPGMVVTVEPGIYLPRWGGVRIEDMVLVTERGREVLTRSITKELVVL